MIIPITGAVEGATDEVALRALCEVVGLDIATVYVTNGKPNLLKRIGGFNAAAQHAPWVVLIDLNGETCAPCLIDAAVGAPAAQMKFRVAVRALEAWLLADAEHVAAFLGVRASAVPAEPDDLPNPKLSLVNLAATSRKRAIREDMAPRAGSGRSVGPNYEGRLIEFMTASATPWRPAVAAARSDSLDRCIRALVS